MKIRYYQFIISTSTIYSCLPKFQIFLHLNELDKSSSHVTSSKNIRIFLLLLSTCAQVRMCLYSSFAIKKKYGSQHYGIQICQCLLSHLRVVNVDTRKFVVLIFKIFYMFKTYFVLSVVNQVKKYLFLKACIVLKLLISIVQYINVKLKYIFEFLWFFIIMNKVPNSFEL